MERKRRNTFEKPTQSPPTVKRALVHAASQLSTRKQASCLQPHTGPHPPHHTTPPHPPHPQAQVITVDQRPLVLHLLIGLCRAGLERAVVAVGEGAELIEAAVREAELPMQVDYVTVPPSLWRNLANSILMCKAAFKTDEPLLIVRADQLYDWRLLRKIVCAPFVPGIDAFALVDPAPDTLEWASGALCGPSCKHAGNTGRCNALVKVARGADGRAVRCRRMLRVPLWWCHSSLLWAPGTGSPGHWLPPALRTSRRAARGPLVRPCGPAEVADGAPFHTPRCGHRLGSYDAVVAGDVYASRPKIFDVMGRLATQNMYSTTSEAMQELAVAGAPRCLTHPDPNPNPDLTEAAIHTVGLYNDAEVYVDSGSAW